MSNIFTLTRKLVNLAETEGTPFIVSPDSPPLSHDGYGDIFISDYDDLGNHAVHMLSETGQYKSQLISLSTQFFTYWRLSFQKQKQQMYVAHSDGVLKVFNLIYEKASND